MSQGPSTREKNRKIKVLIVDDHALVREGLTAIIEREKDLIVCAVASDALSGLAKAKQAKPDIALIDISLEGVSGLELTKTLRAKMPKMKVLIVSMHKEFLYAERALRCGANGYLMKQETGRQLIDVMRRILKGETCVSDAVNELILQNLSRRGQAFETSPVERLSDREFEVFQRIARGYGTRQIAEELSLSMKTVESHRERIRDKLSLKTTFELVQCALQWAKDQKSDQ